MCLDSEILILILLFVTIVPLSASILAVFVVRDILKWEKTKTKNKKF